MSIKKITDDFPSLAGAGAYLFGYRRWDRLLFLEISGNKKQDNLFLVCHNCEFLEFDGYVSIDKIQVIQDVKIIVLKEPSSNFLLKCTAIELWDNDKYNSYDSELFFRLREKRYGIRKPIMSVEELP